MELAVKTLAGLLRSQGRSFRLCRLYHRSIVTNCSLPNLGGQRLREGGDVSPPLDVNHKAPDYDFIIAGGGLIGTVLAVALARTKRLENKKVLLLETANKTFKKEPTGETDKSQSADFSNRVFAISPGSKHVLQKLGIWDYVWRFQEVTSLQVWDALSDTSISFNNPDFQTPVFCVVESPVLSYAVSQVLAEHGQNIEVEHGSFVKTCRIPPSETHCAPATVELKDGRIFTTKLLVGADGYGSRVRGAMNSKYISYNYDRTAVVATLQLSEPTENNVAWQRFLPKGGPIALLPLSPRHSSLVWCTTQERATELMEMSAEVFVEAVNAAYWENHSRSFLVEKSCNILSSLNMSAKGPRMLPPSISEVSDESRATFPLGFGHSSYYANRRVVLIGDAAHRVHPLAGQGLNLGIGDVDCLQKVINRSVGVGGDYGMLPVLAEYETERQRHNLAIQSGIEFLHRLYSFDLPPVVALRAMGLSFVNSSQSLKNFIISQAAA